MSFVHSNSKFSTYSGSSGSITTNFISSLTSGLFYNFKVIKQGKRNIKKKIKKSKSNARIKYMSKSKRLRKKSSSSIDSSISGKLSELYSRNQINRDRKKSKKKYISDVSKKIKKIKKIKKTPKTKWIKKSKSDEIRFRYKHKFRIKKGRHGSRSGDIVLRKYKTSLKKKKRGWGNKKKKKKKMTIEKTKVNWNVDRGLFRKVEKKERIKSRVSYKNRNPGQRKKMIMKKKKTRQVFPYIKEIPKRKQRKLMNRNVKSNGNLIILEKKLPYKRSLSFSTTKRRKNKNKNKKRKHTSLIKSSLKSISGEINNLLIINNPRIKKLVEKLERKGYFLDHSKINLNYNDIIGTGSFGTVHKGTMKVGGLDLVVAIKRVHLCISKKCRDKNEKKKNDCFPLINERTTTTTTTTTEKKTDSEIKVDNEKIERLEKIINEILLMELIGKHKNILQCIGVYFKDMCGYIVLEYCCKGDLRNYIMNQHGGNRRSVSNKELVKLRIPHPFQRLRSKSLSGKRETMIIHLLIQIVQGMKFLHECGGTVHRDLKPSNIFLTNKFDKTSKRNITVVKIGDFGDSVNLDNQRKKMNHSKWVKIYGTAIYMAPEIFLVTLGIDPKKSDVYSFGMVMYFMFTNIEPFNEELKQLQKDKKCSSQELISHFQKKYKKAQHYAFFRGFEKLDQFYTTPTVSQHSTIKKIDEFSNDGDMEFCPDLSVFRKLNINPKCIDLMKYCWDFNPKSRPSFKEILDFLLNSLGGSKKWGGGWR